MRLRSNEEFLSALADIMWTGHHWIAKRGTHPVTVKRPLVKEDIERHAAGGTPVGLCPIAPGESTTRVALLDMDSHHGEVPWVEMIAHASRVIYGARLRGLRPIMFRSSGGHGIHLMFLWRDAQPARDVRSLLTAVLVAAGFKSGVKGVAAGEVEVFPKQDAVPAGQFGSMFVLPFARESVWLDHENGFEPSIAVPEILYSDTVPVAPTRTQEPRTSTPVSGTPGEISAALDVVDPGTLDYDGWRNVVFAIHSGTGGSEEGLALARAWSERSPKYDPHYKNSPDWLAHVWDGATRNGEREGGITLSTLFAMARARESAEDIAAGITYADGAAESETDDWVREPSAAAAPLRLTYTDTADLEINPPPPIEWVVDGWIARGAVTLLFARGGFGKSMIMQQLLTAVANGRPWLGIHVREGTAMGVFSEEDEHEQRRRQQRIFAHYDILSEPGSANLHLMARVGEPNVLMSFDRKLGKRTRFLTALRAEVERVRPSVLVLDNAAQMFGGDENTRVEVTQFVNALAGLAREFACAVVLVGHTGKAEGNEYSGSTAWENVGRARLFLEREADGTLTLSVAKSNIGANHTVKLQWENGVFVAFGVGAVSGYTNQISWEVVEAVRDQVARMNPVSHAPQARGSYLPTVMISLGSTRTKDELALAMTRLIALGVLVPDQPYGGSHPKGKPKVGLVVVENHELMPKPLSGNDSHDIL